MNSCEGNPLLLVLNTITFCLYRFLFFILCWWREVRNNTFVCVVSFSSLSVSWHVHCVLLYPIHRISIRRFCSSNDARNLGFGIGGNRRKCHLTCGIVFVSLLFLFGRVGSVPSRFLW